MGDDFLVVPSKMMGDGFLVVTSKMMVGDFPRFPAK